MVNNIILVVLIPVLSSCLPVPSQNFTHLSRGINNLSKDLYRVVSGGGGGNIVISPYSVHSAMSMLYHGSRGETRKQLGQALGLESRNIENVLDENRDLLEDYKEIKNSLDTDIELANSLFSDDDFAVNEDYQLKLMDSYLTKVRTVNFAENDEAVGVINDWVTNKTEGLIENL